MAPYKWGYIYLRTICVKNAGIVQKNIQEL